MWTIIDKAAVVYIAVMAVIMLAFFISGCQQQGTKFQNWDLKDPKKIIWYGSTDGPTTWENPKGIDFRSDGKAYITSQTGKRFLVIHQMLVEID
jgi:hypothetical protein